jgi:hypothetical protein
LSVFRISIFSFSSVNTPRLPSPETRPRKIHSVGKAATVAGGADPGRGAERLSERFLSRQTLGNGSRGAAELAEKIQFPPSALSAPPREKKSRRHLSAFSFPNVRFSSVAGVADPGRGAERFSERLFGREPDLN